MRIKKIKDKKVKQRTLKSSRFLFEQRWCGRALTGLEERIICLEKEANQGCHCRTRDAPALRWSH
jgi:hypothetical protein